MMMKKKMKMMKMKRKMKNIRMKKKMKTKKKKMRGIREPSEVCLIILYLSFY